jgi:Ca-activated chloride channel family protein
MEQVRSNGESRELRDEIVELGTRYGIVTPYTSFLALEPGAQAQGVALDGITAPVRRRDAQPNSAPAGARGMSVAPPPPPPAPMVVTGAEAVAQSRTAREMQDAVTLSAAVSADSLTVQRVGDRTFYMRDGVWTDAEITAGARLPETTVTFGTDDYFALLNRLPALARYFALGEQVAVVLDGRIYRVRPAGHSH